MTMDMDESPELQSMHDLIGWSPISCTEADELRGSRPVSPRSTLTDMDGTYGRPIIYTEWWTQDGDWPILRDYLHDPHSSMAICRHYRNDANTTKGLKP